MVMERRVPDASGRDEAARALARRERAMAICEANPDATFENVWHALILLEEAPVDRLNRSLIRGRAAAIQR